MDLTYDTIQREAESFAKSYRNEHDVPDLPSESELQKYKDLIDTTFGEVKRLVLAHVNQFDPEGGHGFDHLEWVATLAGFIAERECDHLGIKENAKQKIVESTILAGLLHDIMRHLGFGEDHMIEGARVAAEILEKTGLENQNVVDTVKNHDHIDFNPENKDLQIVFGSVFDADHFRYGLEREDTFWRMKEKKGKTPEEVIQDYAFLPQFLTAWKTHYGKEVGPKFIEFGLAVAKHIERTFSNN